MYIERVTDRESLYREELDCSLIVRSFDRETLMTVKGLLHAPYPTEHGKVWDIICDAAAGRIWQTFYEKTSELYPLYSALPPRAGTFGSYYYDGREVETYMDPSSRSLIVNFNTAGKVNPDVPETLTEEEIRFLTEDAGTSLFFRNISEIKG